jgi:hypothetical protein
MDAAQAQVARAMRELVEANREAREALLKSELLLIRNLNAWESGIGVIEMMRTSNASAQREFTNQPISKQTSLRHQLRLLLIRECDAQGMVAREISEIWGFSRQRAAQLIAEARTFQLDQ